MPAVALPKESAYGLAVTVGHRLFYVSGGNGIDWFSSMLRLALNEENGEWQHVSTVFSSILSDSIKSSRVWLLKKNESLFKQC